MNRATKNLGNGVEWVGFNPADNESWVIETKGDWTYVNWQNNEFTQSIEGYVVRQKDGTYNAHNLVKTYDKYFDSKEEAIEFVKSKHGVEVKSKYENGKFVWYEV